MHQFKLPFKYEEEKKVSGLTGLAGLPLYLELLNALKINEVMRRHLDGEEHEDWLWKPSRIVTSLLLLNLAGGGHVDDLRILQADAGFCKLLEKISAYGLNRSERHKQQRLIHAQDARVVPSASTVFRFLKQDGVQGLEGRGQGKAVIPEAGKAAQQLCACNKGLLSALAENALCGSITLDMDATLIETHKEDSFYSYKGFSAYQPLNIWWDEQRVMLYTEFRDGNVPADYSLQPALDKALSCLPESVRGKPLFLRSDTAAYNIDLLKHCEDEHIQFAIGCPINKGIRKEILKLPSCAWKKLDELREYAEVCFVPNSLATTKKNEYEFRYIATRELLKERQIPLPGTPEESYPFPTGEIDGQIYKIHAIVSNRNIEGSQIISWYYKRCGHSEEVHSILKTDLAGGVLPSNNFHANALWWWIAIMAYNIHSAFKSLCCGKSWLTSRLKRMRFHIICIPGRVVERGRQLFIRLDAGHPSYALFQLIREAICHLRPCRSF
jgi:hypothetical protein